MSIKILVADDEVRLAKKFCSRLKEAWPEIDEITVVHDGKSALEVIEKNPPNIAFLDIQMPVMTGLEVARHAQDQCHIVFATAYDEHAIEAFEMGAIDYIVKPIEQDRLALTVARLQTNINKKPVNMQQQLGQIKVTEPVEYLKFIKASSGYNMYLIPVEDVIMFKTDGRYTQVVTQNSAPLISVTLKELETQLDPEKFWRVRGASIVNITKVKKIVKKGRDNIKLFLHDFDDVISVSRIYSNRFKKM
jgi:DNA-binding LytR/AlgR family response regulator